MEEKSTSTGTRLSESKSEKSARSDESKHGHVGWMLPGRSQDTKLLSSSSELCMEKSTCHIVSSNVSRTGREPSRSESGQALLARIHQSILQLISMNEVKRPPEPKPHTPSNLQLCSDLPEPTITRPWNRRSLSSISQQALQNEGSVALIRSNRVLSKNPSLSQVYVATAESISSPPSCALRRKSGQNGIRLSSLTPGRCSAPSMGSVSMGCALPQM